MKQPVRLPPGVKPIPAAPIVPTPPDSKQKLSLEQAMALATQQQAAGDLEKAKSILQQVLRAQPELDKALHLRGIIAHQEGDLALALELTGKAIANNPAVSLYHSNRAEFARISGDLATAIKHGEQAVALEPDSVAAHSNLGIAYYDSKNIDAAEACQLQALSLDPRFVAALNNLGSIQRERKDKEGAIARYREVLAIQPQYLEALNNLGAVLTENEQYEEALQTLLSALKLKPDYADAHSNIGNTLVAMEDFDGALVAYQKALDLRPEYTEAFQGLARVLQEQGELDDAESAAQKALQLSPEKPEVFCLLAGIYSDQGFTDKAMQAYDHALTLDSELLRAHTGKGGLLMELGQLKEAEQSHMRALELEPDSLPSRIALTHVRKATVNDDNLAELERKALDIDDMYRTKAMALHFALGKSYDDMRQYNKAFPHFLKGCELKRKGIEYRPADTQVLINCLIDFFDADCFKRYAGGGDDSRLPIFVLGMPRSGTTLTEQIIASHPDVYGAGELPDLLGLAHSADDAEDNIFYPQSFSGHDKASMAQLGQRYVEGLQRRSPESSRITDKMPANFFAVGLIHMMLPHAKIIHVRRNPMDTCISGFSKMYNRGQLYSYDLAELGHYYKQYARLMEHWAEVLPPGRMLQLQYEDLVADSEVQARRLIDYCDLEWHDDCLNFHETKRSIRTASVTQVRQPIYQSSVQRWKRYEDFLQPLLDNLGPELVDNC